MPDSLNLNPLLSPDGVEQLTQYWQYLQGAVAVFILAILKRIVPPRWAQFVSYEHQQTIVLTVLLLIVVIAFRVDVTPQEFVDTVLKGIGVATIGYGTLKYSADARAKRMSSQARRQRP